MIQFASEPCRCPLARDLHVVPPGPDFPAGDVDPVLKPPELEVVARKFPPQGDQGIPQPLLRGGEVRRGRLDLPADAAEDVDLPRGVEPRQIEVLLAALCRSGSRAQNGRLVPPEPLVFSRELPFGQ